MSPENKDSKTIQAPPLQAPVFQGVTPRVMVLSMIGHGNSVFRMNKDRIVIGSVVSADVRLAGQGVSPIHAVLEFTRETATDPGKVTVYDLASDTGVFLNDSRVITKSVQQGDQLKIGEFTLKFSLEDVSQSPRSERTIESGGRKLFIGKDEDLGSLLSDDQREVREIFDYRPTAKPALEVVMSWAGTILDIEHFTTERAVTVGKDRGADFSIPPILGAKRFPIVTRQGDAYLLNIDPQMKGVMQSQGALLTLDRVRAQAANGTQVPLAREDFAKVSIGEIDFYLSYTAAPPRLKSRKILDKDPLFLRILITSLLFTALTIVGVMNVNVPKNLDAEQLPERLATVLYQPERYVQKPKVEKYREEAREHVEKTPAPREPKPRPTTKLAITPKASDVHKPVPKEMNTAKKTHNSKSTVVAKAPGGSKGQNQAKEGPGAKAKGVTGTRGTPKAKPNENPQTAAKRPSPDGGQGRGNGNSQVPDEGNVDVLKGATDKIQNLLGNSAANLGKGGSKLQGFGGFNTQGGGGLALSGSGAGGGGDAASLGGLTDHGRGGGRVGTGQGAAGNGNGIIGGKTRVAIRSGGPEEGVVMGSIDADGVAAALAAHRDEFRLCYEKEINAEHPGLAGRVGTSFVIGSSGRVTQAGIESTTLKNGNTERCILTVIKRIDFPVPRGGGVVQVTYPFKFTPVKGR